VFVRADSNARDVHPVFLDEPQHWRRDFDSVGSGGKQDSWFVIEFEIGPSVVGNDDLILRIFVQKLGERLADCFGCERFVSMVRPEISVFLLNLRRCESRTVTGVFYRLEVGRLVRAVAFEFDND
jgi:hypothetical protein